MSRGNDFVGVKGEKPTNQQSKIQENVYQQKGSENKELDASIKCNIRVISEKSFIEDSALDQLRWTSKLPFMKLVVGLPDLHPGKQFPIGSACASQNVIYPPLVGTDIGCGMALWKTSLKNKKLQVHKWAEKLNGLESKWKGDARQWLHDRGVEPTEQDKTLGTIGLGNHFAELQLVEEILDQEAFESLGLDESSLYLLVHSGSRSYGESILSEHLEKYGHKGLLEDSEECKRYLEQHNNAMQWAKANRSLIAHRFMACLMGNEISTTKDEETSDGSTRVLDVWHNYVEKKKFTNQEDEKELNLWLHRKGAAPTDKGPVVIPGSRGDYSYLVMPSESTEDLEKSGFSLAHGAGRKWNRGKTFDKLKEEYPNSSDLKTTSLGSVVICEKKSVLYEESPDAYKDIEAILNDLQHFNLIKVVAKFRPLVTYKMRKSVRFNTN